MSFCILDYSLHLQQFQWWWCCLSTQIKSNSSSGPTSGTPDMDCQNARNPELLGNWQIFSNLTWVRRHFEKKFTEPDTDSENASLSKLVSKFVELKLCALKFEEKDQGEKDHRAGINYQRRLLSSKHVIIMITCVSQCHQISSTTRYAKCTVCIVS